MAIDEAKFEAFLGHIVGDLAACSPGVMTVIDHKLGLYKAMAGAGPMSSGELADNTGTHERYVREWLNNQAAGGYVVYDAVSRTYELPEGRGFVLANPESPFFTFAAPPRCRSTWCSKRNPNWLAARLK